MEQVLFEEGNVRVTAARLEIGSFSYPIRTITSYRRLRFSGSIFTILPLIFGFIGLASGLALKDTLWLGIGVGLVTYGAFQIFMSETLYIRTAAGETRAFTTMKRRHMEAVIDALKQAIAQKTSVED